MTYLTVANMHVFWVFSLMLSALCAMRAHDAFTAASPSDGRLRTGLAIVFLSSGLNDLFWYMRWRLMAGGYAETQWFFDHSYLTLVFGALMSVGVALAISEVLWSSYRWAGVGLVAGAIAATWVTGLAQ